MKVPVSLRVVKELDSGITEVFVTSNKPLVNFSFGLPGDASIQSGQYEMTFAAKETAPKSADAPAPEPPAE